MECHVTDGGKDYLCYKKWPANQKPFTPTANLFILPTCLVQHCEVCEFTPCDKCIDGRIVLVKETGEENGNGVWNKKKYSCIDRRNSNTDPCPLAKYYVKPTRPDIEKFCVGWSYYNNLVGFWFDNN